jgi:hypothetical protein
MRKTVQGGGNENDRTRNDSLPLTALISSRDTRFIYYWVDLLLLYLVIE